MPIVATRIADAGDLSALVGGIEIDQSDWRGTQWHIRRTDKCASHRNGTRVAERRGMLCRSFPMVIACCAWLLSASASAACDRACSCDHYVLANPVVDFPESGINLVATNPRMFVALTYDATPALDLHPTDDPSASVPLSVEPVPDTRAIWVRPTVELAPETSYTLSLRWDVSYSDLYDRDITFHTGQGPDTTPATIVDASTELVPDGERCDPFVGIRVHTTLEDTADDFLNLLEIRIASPGQPERVFYRVEYDEFPRSFTLGGSDGSICPADWPEPQFVPTIPTAEAGQVVRITLTAFDDAGNASAPVILDNVMLQAAGAGDPTPQCVCSVRAAGGGGPPAALGFLPLVGWLFVRRLRRKRA